MVSLFWSLAVILLAGSVTGHDSYLGKCPNFKPMDGFDFDRVSSAHFVIVQLFISIIPVSAYNWSVFFTVYRKVVRS